jgi:shikimate kinase
MAILLICGPKHVGKTSAGRALAALCHCEFIDLDELVTRQTGKSPRNLYEEGPEQFRKAEAGALAHLMGRLPDGPPSGGRLPHGQPPALRVVAAGGGLIDNDAAMRLVNSGDVVMVYLAVSAATAWDRICAEKSLPPFLNTETPEVTHRALHERRAAAYLASIASGGVQRGWVIQAEGKTSHTIAGEIAAIIGSKQ